MRVLVECYPDTALLRVLGVSKKQLRHERCKGEVVKRVRKFDCAIGLIDEDPASAQPRDLDNYKQIKAAEGLRLLIRRDDKNKRLILVCPRLEDWLITRAKSSGIQTGNYKLPSDPDRLHDIPRYEQKEGFQHFLAELKERDCGMRLYINGFSSDKPGSNEILLLHLISPHQQQLDKPAYSKTVIVSVVSRATMPQNPRRIG